MLSGFRYNRLPRTATMFTATTPLAPRPYLESLGRVFACFDQQDSGNISFGVEVEGQRYFAKTAGPPGSTGLPTSHAVRLAQLANAERLAGSVAHPALTQFRQSCETAWGRMLIYRWATGEHLRAPRRGLPLGDSAHGRFLALPWQERLAAVQSILDLHQALAANGWVVGDFYDGCLLYDFATKRIAVFDLDHYQPSPYENTVGRMFGSTRFMAPEEFERGRIINERTTVFALGRTLSIFLGERVAAVTKVACAVEPDARHATVAALVADLAGRLR